MGPLWQELRYGLRMLRKNPGFTAIAATALALGIGANTAIFSLVEGILFPTFRAGNPGRLVMIYTTGPNRTGYSSSSYPDYLYYREHSTAFSRVAAYARIRITWTHSSQCEYPWAEIVSGNYFQTMALEPWLGRLLSPSDDQPAGSPVVVVSYAFWKDQLDSEPSTAGRALELNGQPFTIVGVAPKDFGGVNLDWGSSPELWVTMSAAPSVMPTNTDLLGSREARWLLMLGRLNGRVTLSQARAEVRVLAGRLEQEFPVADKGRAALVLPLREARFWPGWRESVVEVLSLLFVAAGLVMLVSAADVANLLLAESSARHREIGIRVALGAGRLRVIRQLLTESLLVCLAGASLGLLVALMLMSLIPAFGLPFKIPLAFHLSLDARVLGFSALLSLLTAMISGLAPALIASGSSPHESLKETSTQMTVARTGRHLQNSLVVAQVAIAFVSVAGAALSLRGLRNAKATNLGFDPHGVLEATTGSPSQRYSEQKGLRFYSQLLERLERAPGIQSEALAEFAPLSLLRRTARVTREGEENTSENSGIQAEWEVLSPGYFRTLRVPILRGRDFQSEDDRNAPPVVIVNRTLAGALWPHEEVVGKRIRLSGERADREVIGMAADMKYHELWEAPLPYVYLPLAQSYAPELQLFVRTEGGPMSVLPEVRTAVAQVDPQVPVFDVETLEEQVARSLSQPKMLSSLLGSFGVLTLILSVIGTYGLLSFDAKRRTHEVGIRMALGAQRGNVLGLVISKGFKLTLLGVGVGIVGALGLARLFSSILYDVRPAAPPTFVAVSLILLAVGLVASYIPARRATKVDPMVALRHE